MLSKRPLIVTIAAVLFIIAGVVGMVYHTLELFNQTPFSFEEVWVLLLRVLALVCGLMLLRGVNWARWIALLWIAYHTFLSIWHSLSETLTHAALLIAVAFLLYHPKASAYFKSRNGKHKQSAPAN